MSSRSINDDTSAANEHEANKSRMYLDIGDEFALQTLPARGAGQHVVGFVTARGGVSVEFLDGTDMDLTNPPRPQDCRFALQMPRQYAASKAVRKAKKVLGTDAKTIKMLEEAAGFEQQRNDADLKVRNGQMAVFGSVFQLYSPTANKFIHAEKQIAREDDTALECSLGSSEYRSKMPWFRVMPGFATRNEGDRIRMGDTIILESIKMPQTYVHCNGEGTEPGNTREVNISSTPTRFMIVPVAKYRDVVGTGVNVRGGDFLQLYQRQSQSYLYRDSEGMPSLYRPASSSLVFDAVDPAQVSDRASARADLTWEIEMPMMRWSGASVERMKGDTQQYFSLKDAMSGKFLVQQDDGSIKFQDDDDTPRAHWELQAFDKDTQAFRFSHTTYLIQNRQTRKVLHRRERVKEEVQKTRVKAKSLRRDKKKGGNDEPEEDDPDDLGNDGDGGPELYDVAGIDEARVHQDDLFVCRTLPAPWLKDFGDLQHNIIKLVRFEEQVRKTILERESRGLKRKDAGKDTEMWVGKGADNDSDVKDLIRTHLRKNLDQDVDAPVMSVLLSILMGISVASDKNPLTRDGLINRSLQNMLFEFRIIPLLLGVVQSVMELVPRIDIVNKTYGPELLHFTKCSFRILRMMAKENDVTSRVLYDHLDSLVYQLGFPFNVADVISEIFAGTFDLIRKCEKQFILKIWALAKEQREPRYINFLCVLLQHEGRPIKFNQDAIITVLAEKFPPNFFEADWHVTALEVDTMTMSGDYVHEEHEEEDDETKLARTAKVKEFFFHVAFTKMAALLCAGRHRESIDFFLREKQFGFSYKLVLENMVKDEPCPSRGAYALLMLKLFVDREPYELCAPVQKSRILPNVDVERLDLPAPKRVNPYADLKDVEQPTENFTDLKATILQILSTNEGHIKRTEVDGNQFVCAILDLAQQMLVCGVYDGAFDQRKHSQGVLILGEEGMELGKALLPLLDGRKDGGNDRKGVAEADDRFHLNHENSTVMFMKRRILDVVNTLFAMRASTRVAKLLDTFYSDANLPVTPRKKDVAADLGDDPTALKDETGQISFSNPLSAEGSEIRNFEDETVSPKSRMSMRSPKKKKGGEPWGNLSPKSRSKSESKMVQLAMDRIAEIRVFPKEQDEELTDILVDVLRYTVDPELGFQGFNTLIFYLSQNYVFSKILGEIVVMGTDEEATKFLKAGQAMSEFRRLRKWLHRPEDCKACISLVEGELTKTCSTLEGQNMLRNLNFEEYASRVLLMRLGTPDFQGLMQSTLILVEKFCEGNPENQAVMAGHMEEIFTRLLWDETYVDAAAHCIRSVVMDNKALSLLLGSELVQLVADLSRHFGRRLSLMNLLEKLLYVDGKPLVEMQIKVCKGAMMSKDMLEVSAELDEDEWGDGPAKDRVGMLATIFNFEEATASSKDKDLYRRCRCEAEYYASSLIILAECASGKNPTTELLCASILPFSVCVTRLHEIYDHPDLQRTEEDVTGIKNCTVCFFRDVFIDTNSTHILKTLQRPANGLWALDETTHAHFANPVCVSILGDMEEIRDCTAKDGTCKLSYETRRYLFEQAFMFFVQFAEVMPYNEICKEELEIVTKSYEELNSLVQVALAHQFWTANETGVLQQLKSVTEMWPRSERVDHLGKWSTIVDRSLTLRHNEHTAMWEDIVASLKENMNITRIKGTDRVVGIGIMRVAKALWQVVPSADVLGDHHHHHNPDQMHFASFLVEPLNLELDKMLRTANMSSVPKLLTMLDAARGIPYALSDHFDTSDKTHASEDSFHKFVNVIPLDCTINPDVARVQTAMMKQGWGLLCLKILDVEVFGSMHLCALRLMLALTGGGQRLGNEDAQDCLLEQMTNTEKEMCAGALRRLLRFSVSDLKLQRKHETEVAEAKAEKRDVDMSEVVEQKGHASETLTVMMNMCLGNHRGMQDYILKQPGHLKELNLLADVVSYLNQVERDLGPHVRSWATKSEEDKNKKDDPVLDRSFSALRILIAVVAGPNPQAQAAVCNTEIISVINRMMEYCQYDHTDVLKSGHNSPKRKLMGQVSRLVVTLLEGDPPLEVITAILRGLSWTAWGNQLRVLRSVMENGTVPTDIEYHQAGYTVPVEDRHAAWISGDAFKLMTVIDKTTYGAQAIMKMTEMDGIKGLASKAVFVKPVISDVKTLEYFHARLGEVEIIREGALERLFFWMPDMYMDKVARKEIERQVLQVMDTASRENDDDKLRDFVNGCMDIVNYVLQEDQVKRDLLIRAHEWITDLAAGDSVLYFSFLTSLVCIVAYVPPGQGDPISNGKSLAKETYMRWNNLALEEKWPEMWVVYLVFSSIHLIVCCLAFYHFTTVRVPVMLKRRGRDQRALHMKREGERHDANRKDFLESSIHAYGFSSGIANEKSIMQLFNRYGVVHGVRVVNVVGSVNSWAIVSFTNKSAVDTIIKEAEESEQQIHGTDDIFIEIRHKKVNYKVLVSTLDEEYIGAVGGYMAKLVDDLEYELTSSADSSVGYKAAANLQSIVNLTLGPIGRKIPIQSMYILRYNPQFWEAIFDIVFSVTGFFTSPLCLSYHLIRVSKLTGASIVLKSISYNLPRIATTLLLALLMMYYFAISGVVFFQSDHTASKTLNEERPCDNLLSCFVSYSMVGLTQEGLGKWLELVTIPQDFEQLGDTETLRIFWEITFMLATSCIIIAIITGIICDTFGELRTQQDEAQAYRSNTCFITGIPYSSVMPEKSTSHMQYAFLLLYLVGRKQVQLTPVEKYLYEEITHGHIAWLPKGRCFSLQDQFHEEAMMEKAIIDMKMMLTDVNTRLSMIETSSGDVKNEVSSIFTMLDDAQSKQPNMKLL